ncbi:MAG: hypothetical protein GX175_08325 [Halanaerobiaceae bacterium]|nr:hypothetical protein [Halanaerobiaceae bacterium]
MSLYEELIKRKNNGETLKVEDLSSEELKQLFIDERKTDRILAELFEVKQSKITYRRKKLGITLRDVILDELLLCKTEKARKMNLKVKDQIFNIENLNMISKAITHFAFRNGPVEDMHAHPNNKLSDEDMKVLNKFMVNRLAYVFTLIIEERWIEFDFLVRNIDWMYGHDWDEAEPDDGGTRKIIEMEIKEIKLE